ncbi:RNA-binding domain-containing protein [Fomitiporia mediterranea MF3/22]|uniref:RNA-binding domain-containing protein n=1 Tax=Fomitiporia mediterranea (strain MF3/22) TaxID=694068 RepID=UPI0004408C60|nr:RNA-binding domain-containing protein [Fomitiporia mediterranea MF3/22]EJD07751.1 RNA-binding domain-containing protein [Fomitiporia mediterranea MF3/22]
MSTPADSETPGASSSTSHLQFYKATTPEKSDSPPPDADANTISHQRELSKNRLYVGNLHPSVDEYTFLQVFNKYGKISKLDFLFHKSGPSKGKPRGYAFVEYREKEDALKALINAHDKLLRGRKIVVTYANQAPAYESSSIGGSGKHRRTEIQRPTTLSLIKSGSRPGKTEDKIAAMEAKLRQMEKISSPAPSTLPSHPSLPLKPPISVVQSVSDADTTSNPARISTMSISTKNTNPNSGKSAGSTKATSAGVGGIFASGSSSSLGKKPTLEELMKARKAGGAPQVVRLQSIVTFKCISVIIPGESNVSNKQSPEIAEQAGKCESQWLKDRKKHLDYESLSERPGCILSTVVD